MGGWMMSCFLIDRKVEENEAVRMSYCELLGSGWVGVGGWKDMGGWVGGWVVVGGKVWVGGWAGGWVGRLSYLRWRARRDRGRRLFGWVGGWMVCPFYLLDLLIHPPTRNPQ